MKTIKSITGLSSFIVLLLLTAPQLQAQQLEWSASFFGFADNREYAASGRYPQSILGVRFSPEIGLLADSSHRLRAGMNLLQEFGSANSVDRVNPVVYYNYEQYGFRLYMGLFPRHGLLDTYPRAVLNDTLLYYRPNVEGMLLRYENSKVMQQVWIDWTSRQTAENKEQFLAGLSGEVRFGWFFFNHHVMMWHDAGTAVKGENDNVRDNAAATIRAGLNLSPATILDSLTISAGGLFSYDRLRDVYDARTSGGALFELHAAYRMFSVTNNFYTGDAHDIPYGDRFYTATRYNRLDLGWTPLRRGNLEGRFTASFHFTPGAVDNQQMFLLRYHLGGRHQLNRSAISAR